MNTPSLIKPDRSVKKSTLTAFFGAVHGNPRAARTVGWALHSTPAHLDIPWHRVINSKGRISTDCGEHSPSLQRYLLEEEGVEFDVRDYVDMDRFQWQPDIETIDAILAKTVL